MNTIFTFCGPIGSGKSSVSKLFAAKVEAGWNSFGTTTREIAQERRLPVSREDLQRLGADLVANERDTFCRRVLNRATESGKKYAVVDGLRHRDVLQTLRKINHPDTVVVVYIDAPLAIRLERVKERDGLAADQLAELDQHSTEIEVETHLKGLATFVADNGGSKECCAESIFNWAASQKLLI